MLLHLLERRQHLLGALAGKAELAAKVAGGSAQTFELVPELGVALVGVPEASPPIELRRDIAAVWQSILGPDARVLAARVLGFEPERAAVAQVLRSEPRSTVDRAFRTLLRNRVAYRGVMTTYAGLVRRGRDDRGFHSLWNRETLARRILTISALQERIEVLHEDGLGELERHLDDPGVAAFLDPPYTADEPAPGSRLYRHHELNHQRLFRLAAQMRGTRCSPTTPTPR